MSTVCSMWKRVIAVCMIMVTAFMLPSVHVCGAEKKETVYVESFKLFIKENGTYEDAVKWCESQLDGPWYAAKGDLNDGAEAMLKTKTAVFLCYSTTTEKSDAVTDIAVMNEKGNYSEGDYKRVFEEQVQLYKDMVADMKTMLTEYRKNVNNKVETALQAQKLLNAYVEEDSHELLGDLLMDISDDDLAKVLMQANGQAVLLIEQQLAHACDTGKTTWLDRMETLGKSGNAYGKLREQAMRATGNDATKADRILKEKYKESAEKISEKWGVFKEHLKSMEEYAAANGFKDMDEAQIAAFLKSKAGDPKTVVYLSESQIIKALASYKYDGATLMDLLTKDVSEVTADGMKALYPLAASLTDGQIAALDQGSDLFSLASDAINALSYNDSEKGKAADLTAKEKQEMEELKKSVNETLDSFDDTELRSIYEGVDREVFADGGVAVTDTAKNYRTDGGGSWTSALIEQNMYTKLTIGLSAGAVVSAVGAIAASIIGKGIYNTMPEAGYNFIKRYVHFPETVSTYYSAVDASEIDDVINLVRLNTFDEVKEMASKKEIFVLSDGQQLKVNEVYRKLADTGIDVSDGASAKLTMLSTLKWGFTVFCILLTVADIALTAYKLYSYYKVDHIAIPHHMVDVSYNENKETSFLSYRAVRDQDGKCGDLNGNGGLQWLALYESHDKDAGEPILAPENGDAYSFIVQTGSSSLGSDRSSDYQPLHMFGTTGAAQNLTYADGDNGYSYNDKNGGTYMFFRRDTGADIEVSRTSEEVKTDTKASSDETKAEATASPVSGEAVQVAANETGTVISSGVAVLIAAACLVGGVFIGALGYGLVRRRKLR